ncbi:MAG: hypothetical protein IMF11_08990 [Proteobacteria bacterium]|nr:hypothetical protein [Pseudomonadota bacterium]
MDDDKKGTAASDDTGKNEGNFLGSWKTKEDAEAGLSNLQGKLSEQGSEVGILRKQNDDNTVRMDEMQTTIDTGARAGEQETQDREAEKISGEQAKISKQIEDLDPVDEGYTRKLTTLIGKSNALAAQSQHKKTLEAATAAFTEELNNRDVSSAHQSFDGANPDFRTPEMQNRIRERIAADTTGMVDALVAYREIQKDDTEAKNTDLTTQNEELMKRLNLKKGTDETGTVILKDQGGLDPQPKTKTTGADRNKGMQDVLNKQREG